MIWTLQNTFLMPVSYRFIRNSEVAIKRYFSDLGKNLLEEGWVIAFEQN